MAMNLRKPLQVAAVLLLVLALAGSAQADDNYWARPPATPGDWFNTANWSLVRLPTSSDQVYVIDGGQPRAREVDAEENNARHNQFPGEIGRADGFPVFCENRKGGI